MSLKRPYAKGAIVRADRRIIVFLYLPISTAWSGLTFRGQDHRVTIFSPSLPCVHLHQFLFVPFSPMQPYIVLGVKQRGAAGTLRGCSGPSLAAGDLPGLYAP